MTIQRFLLALILSVPAGFFIAFFLDSVTSMHLDPLPCFAAGFILCLAILYKKPARQD